MTTITIWMLINIGYDGAGGRPFALIERFATLQECERVKDVLSSSGGRASGMLRCVQGTVLRLEATK